MELQERKDKLIQFIKDNEIEFREGNRNTPATILAGFSKHLGFKDWADVSEFLYESEELELDPISENEMDRVLKYVYEGTEKDYALFWKTEQARNQFVY